MLKILSITALLLALAYPVLPQAPVPAPAPQGTAPSAQAPIDINHASLDQLLHVPGMTRSWAQRIMRFRPYRTKLDLVQEGVMPLEVYRRFREFIIAHQDRK